VHTAPGVARFLPGILACMIARRAGPRYRVLLEVPRTGGMRGWGAVAGAFEQRLAAQVGPGVKEARLHSETRRGRDRVRISLLITVTASDVGQAAVIAWDVFKVTAGEDAAAWDMLGASAKIQSQEKARLTRRPRCVTTGAGLPPACGLQHIVFPGLSG
jgi:hypothetical protein